MHIFQSSIKLVGAVALSALLTNALRHEIPRPDVLHEPVQLTLSGTTNLGDLADYGEDIGATEWTFDTFTTVTLTGWDGTSWEVVEGWNGRGNVEAMPFDGNRTAWLEWVTRAVRTGDDTVLAAGRDNQTPPVWWVIITANRDSDDGEGDN